MCWHALARRTRDVAGPLAGHVLNSIEPRQHAVYLFEREFFHGWFTPRTQTVRKHTFFHGSLSKREKNAAPKSVKSENRFPNQASVVFIEKIHAAMSAKVARFNSIPREVLNRAIRRKSRGSFGSVQFRHQLTATLSSRSYQ